MLTRRAHLFQLVLSLLVGIVATTAVWVSTVNNDSRIPPAVESPRSTYTVDVGVREMNARNEQLVRQLSVLCD